MQPDRKTTKSKLWSTKYFRQLNFEFDWYKEQSEVSFDEPNTCENYIVNATETKKKE